MLQETDGTANGWSEISAKGRSLNNLAKKVGGKWEERGKNRDGIWKKHEKEKARKKYEKRKAAGMAVWEDGGCIGRQAIGCGRYRSLLTCFYRPCAVPAGFRACHAQAAQSPGESARRGYISYASTKKPRITNGTLFNSSRRLPARARKNHGCCGRAPIKQANDARPEKPKNWRCLAGGAGIMQPVTF